MATQDQATETVAQATATVDTTSQEQATMQEPITPAADTAASGDVTTGATDSASADNQSEQATASQEPIAPVTPAVTPKPAVAVVSKAAPQPKNVPMSAEDAQTVAFNTIIAKYEEVGNAFQKVLITTLKAYVEDMAPRKRHTSDGGAMKQYTLWVTIRNVINQAPVEEFKELWNIILGFFLQYQNEAFNERFIFRFAEHWRWAPVELNGFHRIVNLIKLTADPKTRAVALKQVDMNRTLTLPITDEGRQRLLNFYR